MRESTVVLKKPAIKNLLKAQALGLSISKSMPRSNLRKRKGRKDDVDSVDRRLQAKNIFLVAKSLSQGAKLKPNQET